MRILLERIREKTIAITGDRYSIVRLEVDDDTPEEMVSLVIISKGKYMPFTIDDQDFKDQETTIKYCIERVRREFI